MEVIITQTKNERVRILRKTLGLTLESFGKALGVTKSSISGIECEQRSLTEAMAKSICREFRVSYLWLMEGQGEPFTDIPGEVLDDICADYGCDDLDKALIREYLKLTPQQREVIKDYLRRVYGS